jgi:hypothetical protein
MSQEEKSAKKKTDQVPLNFAWKYMSPDSELSEDPYETWQVVETGRILQGRRAFLQNAFATYKAVPGKDVVRVYVDRTVTTPDHAQTLASGSVNFLEMLKSRDKGFAA